MELSVLIQAPPDVVWRHLSDLASHSTWMSDADVIRFENGPTRGVGTRMTVPTRVGPFRTIDRMTVTEWEEARLIVATHQGVVTGEGAFEIIPGTKETTVTWSEKLRFPWWMGGPIGHFLARPLLKRVWTRNLSRLKDLIEAG